MKKVCTRADGGFVCQNESRRMGCDRGARRPAESSKGESINCTQKTRDEFVSIDKPPFHSMRSEFKLAAGLKLACGRKPDWRERERERERGWGG